MLLCHLEWELLRHQGGAGFKFLGRHKYLCFPKTGEAPLWLLPRTLTMLKDLDFLLPAIPQGQGGGHFLLGYNK